MFGKMKGMFDQLQMAQKMMKDENFRAFISHPKVQALFGDPEFQAVLKTQDFQKISSHPKFCSLQGDPEVAALAAKMTPPKGA